ncbi:hypothetical protein ACFFRR_007203 [Megaselia abdita]
MFHILAFTCIFGSALAAPLTPLPLEWANWNFYPTQGNQFYYLLQKPIADVSRSEVKLPLTANLLCASIPLNRQSGNPSDFNEAAQQAASQAQAIGQSIADQIQSGASSVSSQIQDAIASSQSQIQDALGGAGNAFDQLVPGNPPLPMNSEKKDMMVKKPMMPLIKTTLGEPQLLIGQGGQLQQGGLDLVYPELENRFIALESPSIMNLPRLTPLRIRSVNENDKDKHVPKKIDESTPVVNKKA